MDRDRDRCRNFLTDRFTACVIHITAGLIHFIGCVQEHGPEVRD